MSENHIAIIKSHYGGIYKLAFSPDGKYIISKEGKNIINVWEYETKKLFCTITVDTGEWIEHVRVSPTKNYVICFNVIQSDQLGELMIWDFLKRECVKKIEISSVEDGLLESLVVSKNYIICGFQGFENEETIKFFNISTGKKIRGLKGHKDYVYSVAVSPNERFIISGSLDETIKIWEISTGNLVRSINTHAGFVDLINVSPDMNFIVGALSKELGNKNVIGIWELRTGYPYHSYVVHKDDINDLAISPNGEYIISSSDDNTLKIYELSARKLSRSIKDKEGVCSVVVSPDYKYIISGSKVGNIKFWEFKEGKEELKRIEQKKLEAKKKKEEIENKAIQLIQNIASIYTDITFDKLISKTNVQKEKLEIIIEEMIMKGLMKAQIEGDRIIFQKEITKPKEEIKVEKKKKKGILVFVSYATKDMNLYQIKYIAESLTLYPEIDDVLYWQEDMHDNIIKYMNDNLGKCDVVLLFCSPNALKSIPVEKEWTAADALGKPIIPIFIKTEHIPPLLSSRLGIEFNTFEFEKNIQYLYELILKKKG